jgi:hypothetical protein
MVARLEQEIKLTTFLQWAMIYSMWCGWLSQTKTNRGEYTQKLADRFKKLIFDAFDIGQNYSNDQP